MWVSLTLLKNKKNQVEISIQTTFVLSFQELVLIPRLSGIQTHILSHFRLQVQLVKPEPEIANQTRKKHEVTLNEGLQPTLS